MGTSDGLFWKKANKPAAITSLIAGSSIRLLMFFITPVGLAGIDTIVPPAIAFALFVTVALVTQKRYPGTERHGVVDYVPPEGDVVEGDDLKGFVANKS
jgi:SSS family solute:Na+ symporter